MSLMSTGSYKILPSFWILKMFQVLDFCTSLAHSVFVMACWKVVSESGAFGFASIVVFTKTEIVLKWAF